MEFGIVQTMLSQALGNHIINRQPTIKQHCTDAIEDQKQFNLSTLIHVCLFEAAFPICFLYAIIAISSTLKNLLHSLPETLLFSITMKENPGMQRDGF